MSVAALSLQSQGSGGSSLVLPSDASDAGSDAAAAAPPVPAAAAKGPKGAGPVAAGDSGDSEVAGTTAPASDWGEFVAS